ncbi:MAG: hypothetical protein J0I86_10910, partial [Mesorhizobium sp.]|nr:hypothetical protein [Mesorhizobium sp.]
MFYKSALSLTCALFCLSSTALAGSNTNSQTNLPGVTGDYRIVKPPQAEPDDTAGQDKTGQFKIGNVDVRISGDVTIDVGVG